MEGFSSEAELFAAMDAGYLPSAIAAVLFLPLRNVSGHFGVALALWPTACIAV